MPKIPECDALRAGFAHRCSLYCHDPHLICAVHPDGINTESCLDFRLDPNIKEQQQWNPEGYSWYGDELITNRPSRYTAQEQIQILDNHPFFTGVCPQQLDWARSGNPTAPLVQCRHRFNRENQIVHFDCPECDFIDDSV